jgi:hypothetical protein
VDSTEEVYSAAVSQANGFTGIVYGDEEGDEELVQLQNMPLYSTVGSQGLAGFCVGSVGNWQMYSPVTKTSGTQVFSSSHYVCSDFVDVEMAANGQKFGINSNGTIVDINSGHIICHSAFVNATSNQPSVLGFTSNANNIGTTYSALVFYVVFSDGDDPVAPGLKQTKLVSVDMSGNVFPADSALLQSGTSGDVVFYEDTTPHLFTLVSYQTSGQQYFVQLGRIELPNHAGHILSLYDSTTEYLDSAPDTIVALSSCYPGLVVAQYEFVQLSIMLSIITLLALVSLCVFSRKMQASVCLNVASGFMILTWFAACMCILAFVSLA